MGEVSLYWLFPVMNSLGNGLAFPINEDVRGILRGMRGNMGRMDSAVVEESDDEDERVYRRDEDGRWMMHD